MSLQVLQERYFMRKAAGVLPPPSGRDPPVLMVQPGGGHSLRNLASFSLCHREVKETCSWSAEAVLRSQMGRDRRKVCEGRRARPETKRSPSPSGRRGPSTQRVVRPEVPCPSPRTEPLWWPCLQGSASSAPLSFQTSPPPLAAEKDSARGTWAAVPCGVLCPAGSADNLTVLGRSQVLLCPPRPHSPLQVPPRPLPPLGWASPSQTRGHSTSRAKGELTILAFVLGSGGDEPP